MTEKLKKLLPLQAASCWRLARIESPPLGEVSPPASLPDVMAFLDEKLGLRDEPEWAEGPFLAKSWSGSRFSDGSFGVFYAGMDLPTCVGEVAYHQTLHFLEHGTPGMRVHLMAIRAIVSGDFLDVRKGHPALHRPTYDLSRPFGIRAWKAGADGIAYRSVRHAGGECLAVFKRACIQTCNRAGLVAFQWSGSRLEMLG